MSTGPARRCSASACAGCAPSRMHRSTGPRGDSWLLPHEADEDILQRTLRRVQILEPDPGATDVVEQTGDPGALVLLVIGVNQLAAVVRQCQPVAGERRRDRVDP